MSTPAPAHSDVTADLVAEVRAALRAAANPEKAVFFPRFFKAGPGEYAEGDQFLGVTVPQQRQIAKRHYTAAALPDITALLHSPIHEERLTALFMLVLKFKKADEAEREAIYGLYMANTAHINNWDLVDSSASYIVGPWLEHRDRQVLERLARSDLLWDRRIAMLASGYYITQHDFEWPLRIATILLHDPHDLIHKAVGWMLREIGKRDLAAEEAFLLEGGRYKTMPRTMLRYAIEKFSPSRRAAYMAGTAGHPA